MCTPPPTEMIKFVPGHGHYCRGRVLGHGMSSCVYEMLPLDYSGKVVPIAMKHIEKERLDNLRLAAIAAEHDIIQRISAAVVENNALPASKRHPGAQHVLHLIHYEETATDIFFYTPLAQDGDVITFSEYLYGRTKSMDIPLPLIRSMFVQIAMALDFVHTKTRIVHRDVKLDNILVVSHEPMKILLGDWGLAEVIPEGDNPFMSKLCGSVFYLAPEMILGEPYDGTLVDMWSLGIVLYMLCYINQPFGLPDATFKQITRAIIENELVFPPNANDVVTDLIQCLLRKDPTERYRLHRVFQHPFVRDV